MYVYTFIYVYIFVTSLNPTLLTLIPNSYPFNTIYMRVYRRYHGLSTATRAFTTQGDTDLYFSWVQCSGYLLLFCSVISVPFIVYLCLIGWSALIVYRSGFVIPSL
jgi:hypothetical protein